MSTSENVMQNNVNSVSMSFKHIEPLFIGWKSGIRVIVPQWIVAKSDTPEVDVHPDTLFAWDGYLVNNDGTNMTVKFTTDVIPKSGWEKYGTKFVFNNEPRAKAYALKLNRIRFGTQFGTTTTTTPVVTAPTTPVLAPTTTGTSPTTPVVLAPTDNLLEIEEEFNLVYDGGEEIPEVELNRVSKSVLGKRKRNSEITVDSQGFFGETEIVDAVQQPAEKKRKVTDSVVEEIRSTSTGSAAVKLVPWGGRNSVSYQDTGIKIRSGSEYVKNLMDLSFVDGQRFTRKQIRDIVEPLNRDSVNRKTGKKFNWPQLMGQYLGSVSLLNNDKYVRTLKREGAPRHYRYYLEEARLDDCEVVEIDDDAQNSISNPLVIDENDEFSF